MVVPRSSRVKCFYGQKGSYLWANRAEMFARQVKRKFPSVAAQVEPILGKLDEERLFAFGEALLYMQTPEECLAWFDGK